MHLRKNGVKRTEEKFEMNGERIEVIEEYKYLGCTINQHLECTVRGIIKLPSTCVRTPIRQTVRTRTYTHV